VARWFNTRMAHLDRAYSVTVAEDVIAPRPLHLVGRRTELSSVSAFADRVVLGCPGLVLVAGEAGIGKTRFITAAVEQLSDFRILTGHCLNLRAADVPFAPIAELLRQAGTTLADRAVAALTGADPMPRARMFELLCSAVSTLAEAKPTVLVIEDLHWADPETQDALIALLTTANAGRWILLGSYRDTEVGPATPLRSLLEQLTRHRPIERIRLPRLTREEVAGQVALLTGARAVEEDVTLLHTRSDGVPLYVEEIVTARRAGRSQVPDHLRELFLARLDALPVDAADLVRLAAVAGSPVDERVLAEAAGPAVVEAVQAAVTDGFLVPEGRSLRFHHELMREAVYDATVPLRRAQLHRRVAETLEQLGPPGSGALSHHWYHAGELALAAEAACHAVHEAEGMHAQNAALEHYQRILELWPHLGRGPAERLEVVANAAEAAYLTGDYPRAILLAREAVAASGSDPVRHVRCLERLGRYCWGGGEGATAVEAFSTAVRELPDDSPGDVRVQVLFGHGWMLGSMGHLSDLRPVAADALAICEATGDPLQGARAHLIAAWLPEYGVDAARRARDLALQVDADDELAMALVRLTYAASFSGRATDALAEARDGLRLAERRGWQRGYRTLFAGYTAWPLLDLGRWDEAAECLDRVLPPVVRDMPGAYGAMEAARLAAGRGDTQTLRRRVDQVVAVCDRAPQHPTPRLVARTAEADHLLWTEEAARALDAVEETLAQVVDIAEFAVLGAALIGAGGRAAADLAVVARAGGDPVVDLTSRLDSVIGRFPAGDGPRIAALARELDAESGRFHNDRDAGPWRAAVEAWDELGDPYHGGYCRWRLGQVLLTRRAGRGEARLVLANAAAAADRLAAEPLQTAVSATASFARLEPVDPGQPDTAAQRLGLTSREVEVLELVAAGRSNKQIAESLGHQRPHGRGARVQDPG
jgi:tetratricopeptide (TPR) repeat protein